MAPKGRPTPKRADVRAARRKPVVAPRGAAARSGSRLTMREMRQAMKDGDERNYPPNAAGPERALVRDVVDGRRSFGWLAIPGWVVGMTLTLVPTVATKAAGSVLFPLVLGVVVADSFGVARGVRRALAERFPDGTTAPARSLAWYGVARNTQVRRMRLPRPRVAPGSSAATG
jgi:hypothetical protein